MHRFLSSSAPSVIRVGVAVTVFDGAGQRVLLVKRSKPPFRDHWSLPGGSLELHESISAAAIREIREETGITLEKVSKPFTCTEIISATAHWILVHVAASAAADAQPVADDDAADAKFVSADEIKRRCTKQTTSSSVNVHDTLPPDALFVADLQQVIEQAIMATPKKR